MRSFHLRCAFTLFFTLATTFSFATQKFETLEQQIKDEYFVVLKNKPAIAGQVKLYQENKENIRRVEKKLQSIGGKILKKFMYAFVGLHVKIEGSTLRMIDDPAISYIEKNGIAYINRKSLAVKSWGIDRIDQRDLPLDNTFVAPTDGAGAHIYVVDTGIRSTHQEFTGRIGDGISVVPNDPSIEDCNVHGTHVSGTAMGSTAGVARQSIVHPVRVFGCSGGASWATIIEGIEWVIQNHKKPAVANFSLGGGANTAVDEAIANLVNAGVTTVVSAGNDNGDACTKSPARAPSAITVAASTASDQKSSYSNWGSCVDIIAPGSSIISSSIGSDTEYRSLSGTSMSSPHVTGGAALILGTNPNLTPEQVASALIANASQDKIAGFDPSTPNKLLYVQEESLPKPIVDAGRDKIVRFPKSIQLLGKARQRDGKIVRAYWEQISGHKLEVSTSQLGSSSNWNIPLVVENAPVGTYLFMLTAENDLGESASDTVQVIVTDKNISPVADAGQDRKENSKKKFIVLNGGKSYDPDGEISKFQWEQISGPNKVQISAGNKKRAIVRGFDVGDYVFSLTVTDNEGATAKDEIMIAVK